MIFKITLYDGEALEVDGAPDPTGITYQEQSSIIIPGEENVMHMILIPWASISKVEYDITPDMIAPDTDDKPQLNRAQRRAK